MAEFLSLFLVPLHAAAAVILVAACTILPVWAGAYPGSPILELFPQSSAVNAVPVLTISSCILVFTGIYEATVFSAEWQETGRASDRTGVFLFAKPLLKADFDCIVTMAILGGFTRCCRIIYTRLWNAKPRPQLHPSEPAEVIKDA